MSPSFDGAALPKLTIRGLYAVTPEGLSSVELIARVKAALEGGARIVQYREKTKHAQRRVHEAEALRKLCGEFSALFIVNDDASLAQRVGADAVHLGRHDTYPLTPMNIGMSCYNEWERVENAIQQGAAYVALGAVFNSLTKPQAQRAPLDLLTRARSLHVPVVAIGGITLENAPAVLHAGADAIAVVSDLFDAADVAQRACDYARLFENIEDN